MRLGDLTMDMPSDEKTSLSWLEDQIEKRGLPIVVYIIPAYKNQAAYIALEIDEYALWDAGASAEDRQKLWEDIERIKRGFVRKFF